MEQQRIQFPRYLVFPTTYTSCSTRTVQSVTTSFKLFTESYISMHNMDYLICLLTRFISNNKPSNYLLKTFVNIF